MKELFVLSEAMARIYAASASADLFDFSARFFCALQSVLQFERAIIHVAGKMIPSHTDLLQIPVVTDDLNFWRASRGENSDGGQFETKVILASANSTAASSPAVPWISWPTDVFRFKACPDPMRRLVCFNPLGIRSQGLVPDWLLLYRGAACAFVHADVQAVCALWPHFLTAYDRLLIAQLDTADRCLARRTRALVSRSGVVLAGDVDFRSAVTEEWPEAVHPYLPAQAIPNATLPFRYEGKRIRMTATAGESNEFLVYHLERK